MTAAGMCDVGSSARSPRGRPRRRAPYGAVFVLALATWALAACGASSRGASSVTGTAQAAPCPPGHQQKLARNPWRLASQRLVPLGAAAMRLCRYAGVNGHPPGALVHSRLVTDPVLLGELTEQFNGLPAFPPGPVSCPIDDGSQILALLVYADGRNVTIASDLTGCQLVTNGDLIRTAAGFGAAPQAGERLLHELERLDGDPER